MKKISIVIVTWNCREYAEECLTSLRNQTGDFSKEIIVVDNNSTDGTADMIAARFPEVDLMRSKENLGFSRGNNLALVRTTGDYICLINPDVNIAPGCIRTLFEYMERETAVGLVGPKMIGPDGVVGRSTMRAPSIWNSFSRALGLDALFPKSRMFGGFLMRDFDHEHTRDVDVLNGWFWMTRRPAMDRVGILDDQLFMYGDDLDWCKRFRNDGWRVVFVAEASAVHYGGGTTKKAPIPFYLALQRANFQYWDKHEGKAKLTLYFLITCLYHVVRIVAYAFAALIGRASRYQAFYKMRRSLVSMFWLSGLGSNRLSEIR